MTYEERLAALEHMFPVGTTRVTQDVKDWLIGKGFLAAPYSFHQLSMRYDGSLFDHAFNSDCASGHHAQFRDAVGTPGVSADCRYVFRAIPVGLVR